MSGVNMHVLSHVAHQVTAAELEYYDQLVEVIPDIASDSKVHRYVYQFVARYKLSL